MTSALRWAAMRVILMFQSKLWETKSQDSVHRPQLLKRKESRNGFEPMALCLPALPLGQTGSWSTNSKRCPLCRCMVLCKWQLFNFLYVCDYDCSLVCKSAIYTAGGKKKKKKIKTKSSCLFRSSLKQINSRLNERYMPIIYASVQCQLTELTDPNYIYNIK